MKRSDALYSKKKNSGHQKVRERATFSYDPSASNSDLKEQIMRLRAMQESPYWNRSFADIAGMILMKAVPEEIQKYTEKPKTNDG